MPNSTYRKSKDTENKYFLNHPSQLKLKSDEGAVLKSASKF